MALADFTRIIQNARNALPGATDDAIRYEIFNVLDEFFQTTNAWRELVEFKVKKSDAPKTCYDVTPDGTATPLCLFDIRDSGGVQQFGTMAVPGELVLNVQPSQDDTYTAEISATIANPTVGTGSMKGLPQCPDWIIERYWADIVDGILGRMMSMPAKPYANQQLAIYHLRRFRGAMARARVDTSHKNLFRGQAWRFPQGFAGRSQR